MKQATPRLHRPFYRNGPSHRDGADVTFQDIVTVFGFRTVTIGKWVTKEEQRIAANLMFDALCDLMDILQVSSKVISLNHSLSIAFGSGGKKHSSAHYDAKTLTLALAKNAGGGALAHEWFHAFDHYIANKMFESQLPQHFASALWLDDAELITHPLNSQLSSCFRHIFLADDPKEVSHFVARSAQADRALNMYYYAQPQELVARAFEAVIQDHHVKNAFLVQGTKQSQEAKLGIYPAQTHVKKISSQLLTYFFQLGKATTDSNNN